MSYPQLTHTHTKKLLQILRVCFVFQATRRNVTIIRKSDSVVHTFKAKDWLWTDEKPDFLLSDSIGETSTWRSCIVTIVVNHSAVGIQSEYMTKQTYHFLAAPNSSGDDSLVCINIAVQKSLSRRSSQDEGVHICFSK